MTSGGDSGHRLRLAVLLSGSGRTLDNFLTEVRAGRLPVEIVGVVSSRGDVRGVARAREEALPNVVLRRNQFDSPLSYGAAIGRELSAWRTELVAMAGFVHLWTIPDAYRERVMNIHPALLPAFGGTGFYGEHVHAAVLASGARFSGCTVHFADNDYDTGPIILQRTVAVEFDDTPSTLAARVFREECRAYPDAVHLFAQNRLAIIGRRVRIRPAPLGAA